MNLFARRSLMSRKGGLAAFVAGCLGLVALLAPRAMAAPQQAAQGDSWTQALRAKFYTYDEGSRLIPLAWLRALKEADGTPFAAALTRYGYLANPFDEGGDGLPIGFTEAQTPRGVIVGMSCAACHTRELMADGNAWRIDGAPSNANFQAFVADLDAAVRRVLASDQAFTPFADAVLGDAAKDATRREILRADLLYWSTRFHAVVAGTLDHVQPWGPTRLDAITMIFNAVAGLAIGPRPIYLMPENIHAGDAPVRYPMLWNWNRQDRTQWTGVAESGTKELALARGITEILGVFDHFRPVKTPGALGALDRDYLLHNTASFAALDDLDEMTGKEIGPPAWPFAADRSLADKGKAVFDRGTADGGCVACHGESEGAVKGTWKTPLVDVGTDRAAWRVLSARIDTGSLEGASIPGHGQPLEANDTALNMLKISVGGILVDSKAQEALQQPVATLVLGALSGLIPTGKEGTRQPLVKNGYEARVLHGIWAAPPFLHDGTVPTLADLLDPPDQRPKSFAIGTQYDPARVGLAAQQPPGTFVLQTTGCDDLESGRSTCGHDYGTHLPPEDKKALLEYLKTL